MENLKKIFYVLVFISIGSMLWAQSQTVLQAAYVKSYESEKAGAYTTAINDMKAVYNAKDYTANIRLGWLSYLAKQYTESIRYYNIAIGLNQYSHSMLYLKGCYLYKQFVSL